MADNLLEARLRAFQAWFIGAVAMGLLVFVLSVAFMLYATISIRTTAQQNQSALCALRHDLEVRTDASQAFLDANPNGIPGISSQQIRESLDNQKSTLRALSGLSC